MHTTALAVQVGEHTAILYYSAAAMRAKTSRGFWTNDRRVLQNRWRCPMRFRATRWPMNRADSVSLPGAWPSQVQRLGGDVFPHECQVVLEVIRQVFDHDEQAREEQLSPRRAWRTTRRRASR